MLAQRPATGRWAGLWEFPHGPLTRDELAEDAAARLALTLAGLRVRLGPELITVRHGVTRYAVTMVCFEAAAEGGRFHSPFYVRGKWLRPEELAAFMHRTICAEPYVR